MSPHWGCAALTHFSSVDVHTHTHTHACQFAQEVVGLYRWEHASYWQWVIATADKKCVTCDRKTPTVGTLGTTAKAWWNLPVVVMSNIDVEHLIWSKGHLCTLKNNAIPSLAKHNPPYHSHDQTSRILLLQPLYLAFSMCLWLLGDTLFWYCYIYMPGGGDGAIIMIGLHPCWLAKWRFYILLHLSALLQLWMLHSHIKISSFIYLRDMTWNSDPRGYLGTLELNINEVKRLNLQREETLLPQSAAKTKC